MRRAVIVSAVRTALGGFNGSLAGVGATALWRRPRWRVASPVLVGLGVWIGLGQQSGWSVNGWSLALVVGGLMAALSRYLTFHVTILRSQQAFAVTSQLSMLEGACTLAVAVTATWCWGLAGLYAGTLAVLLAAIAFVVRHRGADLRWAWNTAKIGRLIAIGGLCVVWVAFVYRPMVEHTLIKKLSDVSIAVCLYLFLLHAILQQGWSNFVVPIVFFSDLLLIGFIYVWKKGALEWV